MVNLEYVARVTLSLSTFCIGSAPVYTAGGLSTDPGQIFIDDLVYSNINTAAALHAAHVMETPSTVKKNRIGLQIVTKSTSRCGKGEGAAVPPPTLVNPQMIRTAGGQS